MDFLRPKPSLSTVFSVHTTLRRDESGLREEEAVAVGRRRRMPASLSSDDGCGSVGWLAARVMVRDDDAAGAGWLDIVVFDIGYWRDL